MRWSDADVLALRVIDWLRHEKGEDFSRTSIHRIRRALSRIEQLGERLETQRCRVWVDRRGGIGIGDEEEGFIPLPPGMTQRALDLGEVDLLAAFKSPSGREGPDLQQPRPTLRIVPGKLAGEPHVCDTRVPTAAVAALVRRGFAAAKVVELYTDVSEQSVLEAVDLEDQIRRWTPELDVVPPQRRRAAAEELRQARRECGEAYGREDEVVRDPARMRP